MKMLYVTVVAAVLLTPCFCLSLRREGSSCSAARPCPSPLSCVGTPADMRCFMKKGLGMECGGRREPFWVCRGGLRCTRGRCRRALSVAASCGEPDTTCGEGLSCVGNPGNRKCFKKRTVGMKCGLDPFWVCARGLVCEDNVCKAVRGVAASCGGPTDRCRRGLSCVGRPGRRKCFPLRREGMDCGKDPFWVCVPGLKCVDGRCQNVVGVGGRCDGANNACAAGLTCAGIGARVCVMPKGRGMQCGDDVLDPLWVCRRGLRCVAGVCKKVVSTAGSCNDAGDVCADGLSCVGREGNKKCFTAKLPGMRCGFDPFWVCVSGATCVEQVCKVVVGVAGSCNGSETQCQAGLSCVGRRGNRRCFEKKALGQRCGQDPFWVCQSGLECKFGHCAEKGTYD